MAIEVNNIAKGFDGHAALKDVSLHVDHGNFVALLGPSGSGKTTLLRIIAGLAFADSGQVVMGGRDMTTMPVQGRGIGFVFQNYALFRHMTVENNIAFGLNMMKRGERPAKSAIKDRVGELLDLEDGPSRGARPREQVMAELTTIYRQLDEADAS